MKPVKKRLVAMILGFTMAFAIAACGQDDNPPSDDEVGSWIDRSLVSR